MDFTLSEYDKIRKKIQQYIVSTPVHEINLNEKRIALKLETLQFGGSFKIRGALANILSRPKESVQHVLAVSAGNHAIAAAYAGKILGIPVTVVIPRKFTNPVRVKRCKDLSADVRLVESKSEAFDLVSELESSSGATFIHPFDNLDTIKGTATIAIELLIADQQIDYVFVPIGGGGLISGIASYIKTTKPKVKVIGVEPEVVEKMKSSIKSGNVSAESEARSIADSLCPPTVGKICFEICKRYVDDIVTVSEQEIRDSCGYLYKNAGIASEPAGATGFAGCIKYLKENNKITKPGVIVSGCNFPLEDLLEIVRESDKRTEN